MIDRSLAKHNMPTCRWVSVSASIAIVTLVAFAIPSLRNLELILPDYQPVADEEAEAEIAPAT